MRLTLNRLLDLLLRLLPGSRNDPASIEARVRRVGTVVAPIIAKAIDEEARVIRSAAADAKAAAEDAWLVSTESAKRAKALEALADKIG